MTLYIKSQIAAMKMSNTVVYLERPSLIPALLSSLPTLQNCLHLLCRSARNMNRHYLDHCSLSLWGGDGIGSS